MNSYDYGSDTGSYSGTGVNASSYTGATTAAATSAASGDWTGAAITAGAGLLAGFFQNQANKGDKKDAERIRKEQMLHQLMLAKLSASKGGGGRSRDLDLLEMALGIREDQSKGQSATLQGAANRYAQIYNSAGS